LAGPLRTEFAGGLYHQTGHGMDLFFIPFVIDNYQSKEIYS
jgi:hypothetical protein